jgi:hypothetical protein
LQTNYPEKFEQYKQKEKLPNDMVEKPVELVDDMVEYRTKTEKQPVVPFWVMT